MPKPPITEVIDTMYDMYADHPETELQYETPFQLLIAVIMSAQTTDKQVNVVTKKLYQIVKTPQDILDL
jgi:endonuclease-3